MPARRIPSLNWLRVFEAAARLGSFAKAGEELAISPPAVSKQVRALEGHLGKALFHRGAHSVALSEEGSAFLPSVQQALQSVEVKATALFGAKGSEPLTLQSPAVFTNSWLAARLGRFRDRHPEVQLRLLDSVEPSLQAAPDLAITFGVVPPGMEHDRLFSERVEPVAAPALAAAILSPDDLMRETLIEIPFHRTAWLQILAKAGEIDASRAHFLLVDTTQSALALAAAGYGVALARAPATDFLVEALDLMPCWPKLSIDGSQYYHLIYPTGLGLTPAAAKFRNWLFSEIPPERPVVQAT